MQEHQPLFETEITAFCTGGTMHPVRVAFYNWNRIEVIWNPCEEPEPLCKEWFQTPKWIMYREFNQQRLILVHELVKHGKSAVPHLIRIIKDKVPFIRQIAAQTLGQLGSKEAVLHLNELLSDPCPDVRRTSAIALGRIRSHKAIPYLIKALLDTDKLTRDNAREALALIGRAAIPALLEAYANASYEKWPNYAQTLLQMGAPAVPDLIAALRHENYLIRALCCEILGKLEAAEAVPHLMEMLEDRNWWVRKTSAQALQKMGYNVPEWDEIA